MSVEKEEMVKKLKTAVKNTIVQLHLVNESLNELQAFAKKLGYNIDFTTGDLIKI